MQINPALTIEDFGDEIILVNLHNGAYFSMKGTAAVVWKQLQRSQVMPHFLDQLSATYELGSNSLQSLQQFLHQCVDDELILFDDGEAGHLARYDAPQSGKPSLPVPKYDKFTNMQDILLLDPIHDVGELGWPHPKA